MDFHGWVLVSDLDDTLLNRHSQISEENRRAIADFQHAGGSFTIATGRPPMKVWDFLGDLHPDLPVIAYNGSGLYHPDTGEEIWGLSLTASLHELIAEVRDRFPSAGVAVHSTNRVHLIHPHPCYHYIPGDGIAVTCEDPHGITEAWKKLVIVSSPEELAQISRLPLPDGCDITFSDDSIYEILPAGCNKGTALQKLLQQNGFSPERTIALGNHDNDREMLQSAVFSFAVANATEATKQAAQYLTLDHNEETIRDALLQTERIFQSQNA